MKKLNTRSAASHNHCNGPYSLRRPVSWQSYIQLADLQGQHAWRLNDLTNLQATLHKMTIELVVGHTLLNTSIEPPCLLSSKVTFRPLFLEPASATLL